MGCGCCSRVVLALGQAERGDQVAILYEGDETDEGYEVTYNELLEKVSQFANVLKDQGVRGNFDIYG